MKIKLMAALDISKASEFESEVRDYFETKFAEHAYKLDLANKGCNCSVDIRDNLIVINYNILTKDYDDKASGVVKPNDIVKLAKKYFGADVRITKDISNWGDQIAANIYIEPSDKKIYAIQSRSTGQYYSWMHASGYGWGYGTQSNPDKAEHYDSYEKAEAELERGLGFDRWHRANHNNDFEVVEL